MSIEQLAIHGGPARVPGGPPEWPPPDDDVHEALEAAYRDGSWGRYDGPNCRKLVECMRNWLAIEHVLLCASGTIAVELALRGLGIGAGDEVILAAYDFSGNFRCIEAVGARPVLVDIQHDQWGLDTEQLAAAVSDETRAVIVSHLHGCLTPMRRTMDVARRLNLLVVEDACQVPGAAIDGRRAGSWGDVGVFSFGGSKLLTAGRGGAVVTRHDQIHQRAKIYFDRGNLVAPLCELQAAVLLPQFAKLDDRNARRRQNVQCLLEHCRDIGVLRPAAAARFDCQTAYYKVPWLLADNLPGWDRQALIDAVRAEGVGLDEGFRGFVRRGARRCRRVGDVRHASRAAQSTVLLHHPVLLESPADMQAVAAAMRKVVRLLSGP